MIRQGSMTTVIGRICAAYRLPTAQELVLDSSGSETPMFMKLPHHLQQLSHHIEDIVPQPAHNSQIIVRSVERAVGASHGLTG
jgi:hypothetical protein